MMWTGNLDQKQVATWQCVLFCIFSLLFFVGNARAQSGSSEHIFLTDTNNQVDELYWGSGTGWQSTFFGSSVASGSSLAGFHDSFGEHAIYIDSNQHLHQLIWTSGTGWENQDLTALTGGHLAEAGSGLTAFSDSFGEHVIYLEGSLPFANVMQLLWTQSTGWIRQSIATSIVNGFPLTSFVDSFGEHIIYFSNDSTLHQLLFTKQTGWLNQPLPSQESGSSTQNGLSSFSDSLGEHAFYEGVNGIHQLLWTNATGWEDQEIGGGGIAASGASLTSFADSLGEHVFYIDVADQFHIHQLQWTSGTGWVDHAVPASGISANGSPALTSFADSFGEHIIYFSSQLSSPQPHVYQLLLANNQWFNQDLSTMSHATQIPAGNSSLNSFD